MMTKDVRIDVKLNQFVWSQGIKNLPTRVRIRLSRKKNDDDESGTKWYTLASLIEVSEFKGLLTEKATGNLAK